jgi:hypothetical protein
MRRRARKLLGHAAAAADEGAEELDDGMEGRNSGTRVRTGVQVARKMANLFFLVERKCYVHTGQMGDDAPVFLCFSSVKDRSFDQKLLRFPKVGQRSFVLLNMGSR